MAKKSTTQARERRDFVKFCAFWGLVIAAVLFIVTGILHACGASSTLIGIFDIVAKVALLIAIGIPAYGYVKGRATAWKVVFWVALIIYACGVIFGIISFH